MTNKEVVENALAFSSNVYYEIKSKEQGPSEALQNESQYYAARVLANHMLYQHGKEDNRYTRTKGLRYLVADTSTLAMKTELLKSMVCYSRYLVQQGKPTVLDTRFRQEMTFDQLAHVLTNCVSSDQMSAYQALNNEEILSNCCLAFIEQQTKAKDQLTQIAKTDSMARNLCDNLDVYCARWDKKQTSYHDSFTK